MDRQFDQLSSKICEVHILIFCIHTVVLEKRFDLYTIKNCAEFETTDTNVFHVSFCWYNCEILGLSIKESTAKSFSRIQIFFGSQFENGMNKLFFIPPHIPQVKNDAQFKTKT
jgi:hypothetical protein